MEPLRDVIANSSFGGEGRYSLRGGGTWNADATLSTRPQALEKRHDDAFLFPPPCATRFLPPSNVSQSTSVENLTRTYWSP